MGINANSIIPSIGNLSVRQLKLILSNKKYVLGYQPQQQEVQSNRTFSIDADISWMLYRHARDEPSLPGQVQKIASVLKCFADYGFVVHPICDPNEDEGRHHSKRASVDRRSKSEKRRINTVAARFELNVLSQQIEQVAAQNGPTAELEARRKEVAKIAQVKNHRNMRHKHFHQHLQEYIEKSKLGDQNDMGGSVGRVRVGRFQADPLMAKRYKHGIPVEGTVMTAGSRQFPREGEDDYGYTDLIVGNDVDFAMYVGDQLLAIKGYDIKEGKLSNVEVWFASNSVATRAHGLMTVSEQESLTFKTAAHDLFAQHKDIQTRALIGISLGCDVYPGGVSGFGTVTVSKAISLIKERQQNGDVGGAHADVSNLNAELKKLISSKWGCTESVVDTFVQVILYEPASEAGRDLSYLVSEVPSSVMKYCQEFFDEEACTISGNSPPQLVCPGYDQDENSSHIFLEFEKVSCELCQRDFCCHCCIKHKESSGRQLCIQCYRNERLTGMDESSALMKERDELIGKIRVQTQGGGYDSLSHFTLAELQALYNVVLRDDYKIIHEKPKMPLYGPQCFRDDSLGEKVGSFNIYNEAGSFLGNRTLQPHLPGILKLLAKFVHFDSSKKYTNFHSPVYEIVPCMFTEIANESRPKHCSGYRLLQRCVRHAVDPKSQPRKLDDVLILKTNTNKIAFQMSCAVPASMKSNVYQSKCCIDEDGVLLCSQCTCRFGAKEDESPDADKERPLDLPSNHDAFACVHTLGGAPMKLTLALMDYLANDCCSQLAALWTSIDMNSIFSKSEIESMTKSVIKIATSSLCTNDELNLQNIGSMSIGEVLRQYFSVGTELSKQDGDRLSVSFIDHLPITEMEKISTTRTARRLLKKEKKRPFHSPKHGVELERFKPDYIGIVSLYSMLGKIKAIDLPYAGNKVVRFRADYWTPMDGLSSPAFKELMSLGCTRQNTWDKKKLDRQSRAISCAASHQESSPTASLAKRREVSNTESSQQRFPRIVTPVRNSSIGARQKLSFVMTEKSATEDCCRISKNEHRGFSYKCCFKGCDTNNLNYKKRGLMLQRVPAEPIYPKSGRKNHIIHYDYQRKRRKLILERLEPSAVTMFEPHWCTRHNIGIDDAVKKTYNISLPSGGIARGTHTFINIPTDKGPKHTAVEPPTRIHGGLGVDRFQSRYLKQMMTKSDEDLPGIDKAAMTSLQLMAEKVNSPNKDYSLTAKMLFPTLHQSRSSQSSRQISKSIETSPHNSYKASRFHKANLPKPTIQPGTDDKEIHRRTGFRSEAAMFFFIFTVCNADISVVKKTISSMTWYEEWILYFEFVWGKTNVRWIDREKEFKIFSPVLRKIIDSKLDMVLNCLESWPAFVSYEEDRALCDPKWIMKYGSH